MTARLTKDFGVGRVFNTLLDETMILGLAGGAAQVGLVPIPEIQYLAYFHNAEDQIRGEAASLQFFSNGQYRNPMVVRIASYSYQKGFGGHFHNDNSIGALRDIPGIILATPARGDDAVEMMRTCMASAVVDGSVVLFLEPIALYRTQDLHEAGDGLWLAPYPPPGKAAAIGEPRIYPGGEGETLTIITYANGVFYSLQAQRVLAQEHNLHCRVVDLRWLAPLNVDAILREIQATGNVLVVDECRYTGGGVAEPILAHLVESGLNPMPRAARHTGADSYVPLGPAAPLVSPSRDSIVAAALELMKGGPNHA